MFSIRPLSKKLTEFRQVQRLNSINFSGNPFAQNLLRSNYEQQSGFAAVENEELLGFILYEAQALHAELFPTAGRISTLGVKNSARGQSIDLNLIRTVINEFPQTFVDLPIANVDLIDWWRNLGFFEYAKIDNVARVALLDKSHFNF